MAAACYGAVEHLAVLTTAACFYPPLPSPSHGSSQVHSAHDSIESNGPGTLKRTAFNLYRERGELRGIYPSNLTVQRARSKCAKFLGCSGCDFLVLLVRAAAASTTRATAAVHACSPHI